MRWHRAKPFVGLLAACALVLSGLALAPAAAKGKGKAKKPKKCAPYAPGNLGADADTTIVTDAATESSPIEVTIPVEPGAGFTSTDPPPSGDTGHITHSFHNVQVDTKGKVAGLWARIEYLPTWDHDLYLRLADGTAAAYEADFNPIAGSGLGSTSGGSAEQGVSQIDGYYSLDCAGFTLDIASSIGGGPDVALTLWLGEPG